MRNRRSRRKTVVKSSKTRNLLTIFFLLDYETLRYCYSYPLPVLQKVDYCASVAAVAIPSTAPPSLIDKVQCTGAN